MPASHSSPWTKRVSMPLTRGAPSLRRVARTLWTCASNAARTRAAKSGSSFSRSENEAMRAILHPATDLSAGTGEFLAVSGFRLDDQDLGAVGAVGVPSAGGVAFDAEAVVDLGVVAFAEQPGVLQRGRAAELPGEQMMNFAPVVRGVAAGE